jgi:hypothetical protein
MANKTTADLVRAVLENLTQLETGVDPSADDSEFITGRWTTINANLRRRKISYWTDNSIPDEAFDPVVDYASEVLWQKYKGPRQNNAQIVRAARDELIAAVASPYTGSTQTVEYI